MVLGRFLRTKKGPRGEVLPEDHDGLPDSYRPHGLCPRCDKQSSFDITDSLPVTYDLKSYIAERDGGHSLITLERVSSLICRNCNQGVAVIEEQWIGESRHGEGNSGTITWRGINWWPLPDVRLSSEIPSDVSDAYGEASKTLAAGCYRASAVMARRTLEAIAADKGETTGSLADRLMALAANNVLHPTLSDWAGEVRLIGNVGAHFDPIQQVNREDATQLVAFIRELIKYLYELPAELQRRRGTT